MKRYIPLIEDAWPWLLGSGMTVAAIAAVRIGFVCGVAYRLPAPPSLPSPQPLQDRSE